MRASRLVPRCELWHVRPRLPGELAVAREPLIPEHLCVTLDGLVEYAPGAIKLPREQPLRQGGPRGLGAAASVEMQLLQASEDIAHLTTRVIHVVKRSFGGRERVFRKLDDIAGTSISEQSLEKVDRLIDAAHVAPHLSVRDESMNDKRLVDQREQRRQIRRRTVDRTRGDQQQLPRKPFILMCVVNQHLDQLLPSERLQALSRVIERGQ